MGLSTIVFFFCQSQKENYVLKIYYYSFKYYSSGEKGYFNFYLFQIKGIQNLGYYYNEQSCLNYLFQSQSKHPNILILKFPIVAHYLVSHVWATIIFPFRSLGLCLLKMDLTRLYFFSKFKTYFVSFSCNLMFLGQ